MKISCAGFYLDGRDAKLLPNDIDEHELAQKVLDGAGSPHAVTALAVADAAKTLEFGRHKKQWLNDNEDEIKRLKVDKEEAFATYIAGRIDQAVATIEPDVVDAMSVLLEDTDDEDDDEEDDEDEDDSKPDKE